MRNEKEEQAWPWSPEEEDDDRNVMPYDEWEDILEKDDWDSPI